MAASLESVFNYLNQFQIGKVVIMYECSYCGLSLTRWGNYLEHVGAVHEGGKGMTKFKCRKCQKIFLKQNNFQAHCENQYFQHKASLEQARLCNKLRLRRHLLHKRWAWPRRLALNGPSAR